MFDSRDLRLGREALEDPELESIALYSFGAANNPLLDLVAQGAAGVLQNPEVARVLEAATNNCQEQAQRGAEQFFKENWPYFLAGGAMLVAANYMMLVIGVLPAIRARR